jgi:hypothetical protein
VGAALCLSGATTTLAGSLTLRRLRCYSSATHRSTRRHVVRSTDRSAAEPTIRELRVFAVDPGTTARQLQNVSRNPTYRAFKAAT